MASLRRSALAPLDHRDQSIQHATGLAGCFWATASHTQIVICSCQGLIK
jgi:hypothetical protein